MYNETYLSVLVSTISYFSFTQFYLDSHICIKYNGDNSVEIILLLHITFKIRKGKYSHSFDAFISFNLYAASTYVYTFNYKRDIVAQSRQINKQDSFQMLRHGSTDAINGFPN